MEFCFEDELECLKSSYSESEFSYSLSNSSHILKFNLQCGVSITFEIPSSYPQKSPAISMCIAQLANSDVYNIKSEMIAYAETQIGSPMIMDLVIQAEHLIKNRLPEPSSDEYASDTSQATSMAIILIHHMRQKNKYSKVLTSWVNELDLCGVLLFCRKSIFLILQGCRKHLKEFIVRHRTVSVDVDSCGKPCKEKMSKILFEGNCDRSFSSFCIKEIETNEILETYFHDLKLRSIYQDYIKHALSH